MTDDERRSPAADILPFEITETTLPNGLRIIAFNTGFPNLVSLQIPVQTGSRNEVEPGKTGFAHFFEHMMFRGTERYPADEYQAIITRTGARQNAYTTDDYTNYHLTFAKEDLETVLELEADRFMNLKYSEDDFKTEARAVLGEYNKSSADPLTRLIETQRDLAFTTHTYKHTTMGFLRDIEAMPDQFEYSRTFFERWYQPRHATIVIAGDIDPPAAVEQVARHFGPWAAKTPVELEIPQEPPAEGPVIGHVPWQTDTLPWVSVAFHAPAFSESSPAWAALDLSLDLAFGETSDLYRRLVEQEQVVDQLFPYLPATQDPGLATIFARVRAWDSAEHVRDQILAVISSLRMAAVETARLEQAKSHARYSFVRTLDNSESIAATLARFVRVRRSHETLNALYRTYAALTPEDLLDVARFTFTDANMVLTTLANGAAPEGLPPSLSQFANTATGGDIRLIDQRSPAPLVRLKLLFETGSADDPAGKEGLAAVTAAMIAEGGSRYQRIDEINSALFPLAASFSAQVDREMTTFTCVTHRDTLAKVEAVVLPQLLEPGFREDDFQRLKTVQLNELTQDLRANNEEELAKERLQQIAFTGTAYGHPALGSASGIEAITLDDVRDFASRQYVRSKLTLGVSGDIDEDGPQRWKRRLGALPEGQPSAARRIQPSMPRAIHIEIIEKDTRSVAISLGHPIEVTRTHPDFAALWLARAWLGEHRASHGRLYQRLRELRGMNYGDYAYIEAFPRGMYQFFPDPNLGRRAQLFEIWLRPVRPEQAVFALKAALFELNHLIESGLPEAEFEATREYLAKNVFVMTKTQDAQLGYALDSRWYGLPEFTGWIRGQLAALTLAAVNDAIRRHLSARDLWVVMVARDAAGLRDALLAGDPATISYDGAKPDDVLAEDREIGAYPLKLEGDGAPIVNVGDVFA